MKVVNEKIKFLCEEIENSVGILKGYAQEEKEEFIFTSTSLSNVRFYLIIAIEACIEICCHIIEIEGMETSTSYSDCFRMLGEKGIITEHLSSKLVEMAKFRIILMHLYGREINEKFCPFLH